MKGVVMSKTSLMMAGGLVMMLAQASAAADGAAVYKEHCAKCHGETGAADTAAGKAVKAPALAGDAKVAGMSVADLTKAIKENEKHQKAGVLKKITADADIEAAAGFAKSLAGK